MDWLIKMQEEQLMSRREIIQILPYGGGIVSAGAIASFYLSLPNLNLPRVHKFLENLGVEVFSPIERFGKLSKDEQDEILSALERYVLT